MNSVKLFCQFFKESYLTLLRDFPLYISSYVAFVVINIIASTPWEGLGFEQGSPYEIILSLVVGILSLIVIVNVVLIEKSKVKHDTKEALLYAAPTYLIYTLYSTILILLGIACLIIPGIIVAICVGMVPLASILIDNDSVNYFKISYKMARKDIVLLICFGISSLLIELPSFAFDFIPDWRSRMVFSMLYGFFDAAMLISLTIASVRIFYHLKKALMIQAD